MDMFLLRNISTKTTEYKVVRYENYRSLSERDLKETKHRFLNFLYFMNKCAKLPTANTVFIDSFFFFFFYFPDSGAVLLFGLLPNANFRLSLSTE